MKPLICQVNDKKLTVMPVEQTDDLVLLLQTADGVNSIQIGREGVIMLAHLVKDKLNDMKDRGTL